MSCNLLKFAACAYQSIPKLYSKQTRLWFIIASLLISTTQLLYAQETLRHRTVSKISIATQDELKNLIITNNEKYKDEPYKQIHSSLDYQNLSAFLGYPNFKKIKDDLVTIDWDYVCGRKTSLYSSIEINTHDELRQLMRAHNENIKYKNKPSLQIHTSADYRLLSSKFGYPSSSKLYKKLLTIDWDYIFDRAKPIRSKIAINSQQDLKNLITNHNETYKSEPYKQIHSSLDYQNLANFFSYPNYNKINDELGTIDWDDVCSRAEPIYSEISIKTQAELKSFLKAHNEKYADKTEMQIHSSTDYKNLYQQLGYPTYNTLLYHIENIDWDDACARSRPIYSPMVVKTQEELRYLIAYHNKKFAGIPEKLIGSSRNYADLSSEYNYPSYFALLTRLKPLDWEYLLGRRGMPKSFMNYKEFINAYDEHNKKAKLPGYKYLHPFNSMQDYSEYAEMYGFPSLRIIEKTYAKTPWSQVVVTYKPEERYIQEFNELKKNIENYNVAAKVAKWPLIISESDYLINVKVGSVPNIKYGLVRYSEAQDIVRRADLEMRNLFPLPKETRTTLKKKRQQEQEVNEKEYTYHRPTDKPNVIFSTPFLPKSMIAAMGGNHGPGMLNRAYASVVSNATDLIIWTQNQFSKIKNWKAGFNAKKPKGSFKKTSNGQKMLPGNKNENDTPLAQPDNKTKNVGPMIMPILFTRSSKNSDPSPNDDLMPVNPHEYSWETPDPVDDFLLKETSGKVHQRWKHDGNWTLEDFYKAFERFHRIYPDQFIDSEAKYIENQKIGGWPAFSKFAEVCNIGKITPAKVFQEKVYDFGIDDPTFSITDDFLGFEYQKGVGNKVKKQIPSVVPLEKPEQIIIQTYKDVVKWNIDHPKHIVKNITTYDQYAEAGGFQFYGNLLMACQQFRLNTQHFFLIANTLQQYPEALVKSYDARSETSLLLTAVYYVASDFSYDFYVIVKPSMDGYREVTSELEKYLDQKMKEQGLAVAKNQFLEKNVYFDQGKDRWNIGDFARKILSWNSIPGNEAIRTMKDYERLWTLAKLRRPIQFMKAAEKISTGIGAQVILDWLAFYKNDISQRKEYSLQDYFTLIQTWNRGRRFEDRISSEDSFIRFFEMSGDQHTDYLKTLCSRAEITTKQFFILENILTYEAEQQSNGKKNQPDFAESLKEMKVIYKKLSNIINDEKTNNEIMQSKMREFVKGKRSSGLNMFLTMIIGTPSQETTPDVFNETRTFINYSDLKNGLIRYYIDASTPNSSLPRILMDPPTVRAQYVKYWNPYLKSRGFPKIEQIPELLKDGVFGKTWETLVHEARYALLIHQLENHNREMNHPGLQFHQIKNPDDLRKYGEIYGLGNFEDNWKIVSEANQNWKSVFPNLKMVDSYDGLIKAISFHNSDATKPQIRLDYHYIIADLREYAAKYGFINGKSAPDILVHAHKSPKDLIADIKNGEGAFSAVINNQHINSAGTPRFNTRLSPDFEGNSGGNGSGPTSYENYKNSLLQAVLNKHFPHFRLRLEKGNEFASRIQSDYQFKAQLIDEIVKIGFSGFAAELRKKSDVFGISDHYLLKMIATRSMLHQNYYVLESYLMLPDINPNVVDNGKHSLLVNAILLGDERAVFLFTRHPDTVYSSYYGSKGNRYTPLGAVMLAPNIRKKEFQYMLDHAEEFQESIYPGEQTLWEEIFRKNISNREKNNAIAEMFSDKLGMKKLTPENVFQGDLLEEFHKDPKMVVKKSFLTHDNYIIIPTDFYSNRNPSSTYLGFGPAQWLGKWMNNPHGPSLAQRFLAWTGWIGSSNGQTPSTIQKQQEKDTQDFLQLQKQLMDYNHQAKTINSNSAIITAHEDYFRVFGFEKSMQLSDLLERLGMNWFDFSIPEVNEENAKELHAMISNLFKNILIARDHTKNHGSFLHYFPDVVSLSDFYLNSDLTVSIPRIALFNKIIKMAGVTEHDFMYRLNQELENARLERTPEKSVFFKKIQKGIEDNNKQVRIEQISRNSANSRVMLTRYNYALAWKYTIPGTSEKFPTKMELLNKLGEQTFPALFINHQNRVMGGPPRFNTRLSPDYDNSNSGNNGSKLGIIDLSQNDGGPENPTLKHENFPIVENEWVKEFKVFQSKFSEYNSICPEEDKIKDLLSLWKHKERFGYSEKDIEYVQEVVMKSGETFKSLFSRGTTPKPFETLPPESHILQQIEEIIQIPMDTPKDESTALESDAQEEYQTYMDEVVKILLNEWVYKKQLTIKNIQNIFKQRVDQQNSDLAAKFRSTILKAGKTSDLFWKEVSNIIRSKNALLKNDIADQRSEDQYNAEIIAKAEEAKAASAEFESKYDALKVALDRLNELASKDESKVMPVILTPEDYLMKISHYNLIYQKSRPEIRKLFKNTLGKHWNSFPKLDEVNQILAQTNHGWKNLVPPNPKYVPRKKNGDVAFRKNVDGIRTINDMLNRGIPIGNNAGNDSEFLPIDQDELLQKSNQLFGSDKNSMGGKSRLEISDKEILARDHEFDDLMNPEISVDRKVPSNIDQLKLFVAAYNSKDENKDHQITDEQSYDVVFGQYEELSSTALKKKIGIIDWAFVCEKEMRRNNSSIVIAKSIPDDIQNRDPLNIMEKTAKKSGMFFNILMFGIPTVQNEEVKKDGSSPMSMWIDEESDVDQNHYLPQPNSPSQLAEPGTASPHLNAMIELREVVSKLAMLNTDEAKENYFETQKEKLLGLQEILLKDSNHRSEVIRLLGDVTLRTRIGREFQQNVVYDFPKFFVAGALSHMLLAAIDPKVSDEGFIDLMREFKSNVNFAAGSALGTTLFDVFTPMMGFKLSQKYQEDVMKGMLAPSRKMNLAKVLGQETSLWKGFARNQFSMLAGTMVNLALSAPKDMTTEDFYTHVVTWQVSFVLAQAMTRGTIKAVSLALQDTLKAIKVGSRGNWIIGTALFTIDLTAQGLIMNQMTHAITKMKLQGQIQHGIQSWLASRSDNDLKYILQNMQVYWEMMLETPIQDVTKKYENLQNQMDQNSEFIVLWKGGKAYPSVREVPQAQINTLWGNYLIESGQAQAKMTRSLDPVLLEYIRNIRREKQQAQMDVASCPITMVVTCAENLMEVGRMMGDLHMKVMNMGIDVSMFESDSAGMGKLDVNQWARLMLGLAKYADSNQRQVLLQMMAEYVEGGHASKMTPQKYQEAEKQADIVDGFRPSQIKKYADSIARKESFTLLTEPTDTSAVIEEKVRDKLTEVAYFFKCENGGGEWKDGYIEKRENMIKKHSFQSQKKKIQERMKDVWSGEWSFMADRYQEHISNKNIQIRGLMQVAQKKKSNRLGSSYTQHIYTVPITDGILSPYRQAISCPAGAYGTW